MGTSSPKPPLLSCDEIAMISDALRESHWPPEKDREVRRSGRAAVWAHAAKIGGDIIGWSFIVNFGPAPSPWRFIS